jgi:hypothetical protein
MKFYVIHPASRWYFGGSHVSAMCMCNTLWQSDYTVSRSDVWLLEECELFDVLLGKESWSRCKKVWLYWKFWRRVPTFEWRSISGINAVYRMTLLNTTISHHNSLPLHPILSLLYSVSILISQRSTLVLSSHLCLDLLSDLLPKSA